MTEKSTIDYNNGYNDGNFDDNDDKKTYTYH